MEQVLAMDRAGVQGVSVLFGEFVVVSAEGADHPLYVNAASLLGRLREATGIDALFVSQFVTGRPLVRHTEADASDEEACDPLEAFYGERVLDERPIQRPSVPLPDDRQERMALLMLMRQPPCHHALPVRDAHGRVYGTLCWRRRPEDGDGSRELAALQSLAKLMAGALARTASAAAARSEGGARATSAWQELAVAA